MTTRSVGFHFVDVFADRPLTGNPLTLVPDADDLDVDVMRAIAREFNQSETTFLLRPTVPVADRQLRSFTPAGAEVGGAGHNALGAWLWLADTGQVDAGRYRQQIAGEVLDVEVARGARTRVVMEQSAPGFGATVDDRSTVATALGLEPGDLDDTLPPQVVSTGAAHLLVAVQSRTTVDGLAVDAAALLTVLRAAGGEGCYVFSTEPAGDGAHAYARFFNPTVGIVEDPATGTAAGPLAALLVRSGQVGDGTEVQVEQGHAAGRPSRLSIAVSGDRVRLSGSGLVVAEGRLAL